MHCKNASLEETVWGGFFSLILFFKILREPCHFGSLINLLINESVTLIIPDCLQAG